MNWWLPFRITITGEWLGLIGTVVGILLGFLMENYRNRKNEKKRLKEIKIELRAELKYVSQILISHATEFSSIVDTLYDDDPTIEQAAYFRDRWMGFMEQDRIHVAEVSKIFSKFQSYLGNDTRLDVASTHLEHVNDDYRSFLRDYIFVDLTLGKKEVEAIKKESSNLFNELLNCLNGEVEEIFAVDFEK